MRYSRVAWLFAVWVSLLSLGCAASPEARFDQAVVAYTGAANQVEILVDHGYIKDKNVRDSIRFANNQALSLIVAGNETIQQGKPFDKKFLTNQIFEVAKNLANYVTEYKAKNSSG